MFAIVPNIPKISVPKFAVSLGEESCLDRMCLYVAAMCLARDKLPWDATSAAEPVTEDTAMKMGRDIPIQLLKNLGCHRYT